MKRFIHFTLVLALAIGVVSCKKDDIVNTAKETTKDVPTVKNLPPKQKITLSASSTKSGLRVAYDASKGTDVTDDNTLWEENDQIAVYNVGVNGAPAIFTLVDGAGTSYGTFEGVIEPTGNYYGVYPASAAGMLDGTSIAITLPKNQNYAEGSFGTDAAVFAATYDAPNDVLKFEPLLGYLSLSLTTPSNTSRDANSIVGGHSVGSIVLHENSLGGISLSGNATVDMSSDIPKFISAPAGGGLDVTLNCPSVQLTSSPTEFIIAVPAGAFSKGLCATVKDPSGKKIMSIATTTPNVITTNYITKLPAQDVYNIEDIVGNRYSIAKIGSQIWMGENLQCLKYDKESEGYKNRGAEERDSYVLPNQKYYSPYTTNDPQYVDPKDENTWVENGPGSWVSGGIENVRKQKDHFGILYNWAAAFGFVTGDEAIAYDSGFDGPQMQGICPNGWHMPTWFEFFNTGALVKYVDEGGNRGSAENFCLRSVDGWLKFEGNIPGTDDFGFTVLPAGSCGDGGSVTSNAEVGLVSRFLTATPYGSDCFSVQVVCNPSFSQYGMFDYIQYPKQSFAAVRCLKD